MSSNSSLFSMHAKTQAFEKLTDRESVPILGQERSYSPMRSMLEEDHNPGKIQLTERIYQMLEKSDNDQMLRGDESNIEFISLPRIDLKPENSLLKADYDDDDELNLSQEEDIQLRRDSTMQRTDTQMLMKVFKARIQGLNQDKKVDELFKYAVRVRKRFRVIFYILAILLILAGVIAASYFLLLRGNFKFTNNSSLYLYIEGCNLNIYDADDYENTAGTDMTINYKIPTSLNYFMREDPERYTENDMERVDFVNIYPGATCKIDMYLPKDFQLNSLYIECVYSCNIIQNSTIFQISNALNITGNDAHVNWRNLEVGLVLFDTYTGHFQANHITTTSGNMSQVYILSSGDIIIQSTESIDMYAFTFTETFCFTGGIISSLNMTSPCSLSGDSSIFTLPNDTFCEANYRICQAGGCDSSPSQFKIYSKSGSIYANVIEEIGAPVTGNSTAGKPYENEEIGFDDSVLGNISLFNDIVKDSQNSQTPLMVLNIGNLETKSSNFAKFVATSNPAYSYLKPWWLSTFSLTILGGTQSTLNVNLMPGFCPYYPQITSRRYFKIQSYLKTILAGEKTITTFVRDRYDPLPPDDPEFDYGIFKFILSRNPIEDKWYTMKELDNGYYSYTDNNLSMSWPLIFAMICSFIIAGYVSMYGLKILVYLLNYCYYSICDKIAHQQRYIKLSSKAGKSSNKKQSHEHEEQKEEENVEIRKYGFASLLWNSPSPSAYIDALILMGYRQLMNSVPEFYRILMRPVKIKEHDFENPDPSKEMILGSEAKLLYEKFCFLNFMQEQKLTSSKNLKVLKKYGFEVYCNSQQLSEVFIKILVKNHEGFITNTRVDNAADSLDIFVKENITITAFEEDTFQVEDFFKLYNDFCELNRFPKVSISASLVKERYQIASTKRATQFIRRIPERLQINSKKKIIKYVIDKNKLNDHFALINKTYRDLPENRLRTAVNEYVMFSGWQVWDFLVLVAHILFDCGMSLPLLFLAIFNETEYSPFSLKDPDLLINKSDTSRDPAFMFEKLFTGFGWNIVITVMVIIYWVTAFVDLIMYYTSMDFPQDKIFRKSEKPISKWTRAARIIQWIIVLLNLSFYFGYFSLVGVWWLLGAILNPNAFLPFATGVASFVTFVSIKFVQFKKLAINGKKSIMLFLEKAYTDVVSKVMKKLSSDLEGASEYVQNKGKAVLQSEAFQSIATKLKEAGIVDDAILEDIKRKIESHSLYVKGENLLFVNPSEFLDMMNESIDQLKELVVNKIKAECGRKSIPADLIEIMVSICNEDYEQTHALMEQLVVAHGSEKSIPEDVIRMFFELAFPSNVDKENFPKYATTKIIELLFDKLKQKHPNIDARPEELMNWVVMINCLKSADIKQFHKAIKSILEEHSFLQEHPVFSIYKHIHKLLHVLMTDESYFSLSDTLNKTLETVIGYSIERSAEDKLKKEQSIKFIRITTEILRKCLILDSITDSKDHDAKEDYYEDIEYFINCLKSHEDNEEQNNNILAKIFFYLSRHLLNGDLEGIPSKLVSDLTQFSGLSKITNGDDAIFEFVIKLVSLIYNTTKNGFAEYSMLHEKLKKYRIHDDMMKFIGYTTIYLNESALHQKEIRAELTERSEAFSLMAISLKLSTKELVGLVDLLLRNFSSPAVDDYLLYVMKVLRIPITRLRPLKMTLYILLGNDEWTLSKGVKELDLEFGHLLLASKGLLSPKYITSKLFKTIKIVKAQVIDLKNEVSKNSEEDIESWKNVLKHELSEAYNKIKNTTFDTETMRLQRLADIFLIDWSNTVFTLARLRDIVSGLDNERNNLHSLLSLDDAGNPTTACYEFLYRMLSIKTISLEKKAKLSNKTLKILIQNQEDELKQIAMNLALPYEYFPSFIQVFMIEGYHTETHAALHKLIPEEKATELSLDNPYLEAYYRYCHFDHKSYLQNLKFIDETLARIAPINNELDLTIPGSFYKKFMLGGQYHYTIHDYLELSDAFIGNPDSSSDLEEIYDKFLLASSFLRGKLPANQFLNLNIKSSILPKLLDMLVDESFSNASYQIARLFSNPINPALALYSILELFKQNQFTIPILFKITDDIYNVEKYRKVDKTINEYLGELFDCYPEVFLLFRMLEEDNIDVFIDQCLPLLRRITGNPIIDPNPIKTLFSLILGGSYDPSYLASVKNVDENVIVFLTSICEMCHHDSYKVKRELNYLPKRVQFKAVLETINIDFKEFYCLLKLILGEFDSEALNDYVEKFGFEWEKEYAKGIFQMSELINPESSWFDVSKEYKNTVLKIQDNHSFAHLCYSKERLTCLFRITAGNFLTIKGARNEFSWAFPSSDISSYEALTSLTMALSGLLNIKIKVKFNQNEQSPSHSIIEFYVKERAIKKRNDRGTCIFNEYTPDPDAKFLPNNTIEYAIALLNISSDIPAAWTEIFFLNFEVYREVNIGNSTISREFLLLLVANFSEFPEIVYDVMSAWGALARFEIEINKFEDASIDISSLSVEFDQKICKCLKHIAKIVKDSLDLTYEKAQKYLNKLRLGEKKCWKKLLSSKDTFYKNVNITILSFLREVDVETLDERVYGELELKLCQPTVLFMKWARINLSRRDDDLDKEKLAEKYLIACCKVFDEIKEKFQINRDRCKHAHIENLSILGNINKIRQSDNDSKKFYLLFVLMKNFERIHYTNENFFRMSKFRLMKIIGLSIPIVIPNAISYAKFEHEELYSKDYRRNMFIFKIRSDHEDIRMKLLRRGIDQLRNEYSHETKSTEIITMLDWNTLISKKKLKFWLQGIQEASDQDFHEKLQKDIYYRLNENPIETVLPRDALEHDMKDIHIQDSLIGDLIDPNYKKGTHVDWISGKEIKDLNEDRKGLGFEAAFKDAKRFYNDAYGHPKVATSIFTNQLIKLYYLSKLSRQITLDNLMDLMESFPQLQSESRKLGEILFSIIMKESKLSEVSTMLEVEDDLLKLLFFSTTNSNQKRDENSVTYHKDFEYVANEIKIFKSRDDIELLFDFYISKNVSAFPRLAYRLLKRSRYSENDFKNLPIIKLISCIRMKKFKLYKSNPKLFNYVSPKVIDELYMPRNNSEFSTMNEYLVREIILDLEPFKGVTYNVTVILECQKLFENIFGQIYHKTHDYIEVGSPNLVTDMVPMIDHLSAEDFKKEYHLLKTFIEFESLKHAHFKIEERVDEDTLARDLDHTNLFKLNKSALSNEFQVPLFVSMYTGNILSTVKYLSSYKNSDNSSVPNLISLLSIGKVPQLVEYVPMFVKSVMSKAIPRLQESLSQSNVPGTMIDIQPGSPSSGGYSLQSVIAEWSKHQSLHSKIQSFAKKTFIQMIDRAHSKYEFYYPLETVAQINNVHKHVNALIDGSYLTMLINGMENDDMRLYIKDLFDVMIDCAKIQICENPDAWKSTLVRKFSEAHARLIKIASVDKREYLSLIGDVFGVHVYISNCPNIDNTVLKIYVLTLARKMIGVLPTIETDILIKLSSIIVGMDLNHIESDHIISLRALEMTTNHRADILAKEIIPFLYKGLDLTSGKMEALLNIVQIFRANKYEIIIHDVEKLQGMLMSLQAAFLNLDVIDSGEEFKGIITLIKNLLFYSREEKYEDVLNILLRYTVREESKRSTLMSYFFRTRELLDFSGLKAILKDVTYKSQLAKSDPDQFLSILSKIKEGTGTVKDLFQMVDKAGDGSGSISEEEFNGLANRFGIKMSEHRIKEIFAKIKGKGFNSDSKYELNEKEFTTALDYLQEKNLNQASQMLSISPGILMYVLARLILLFILILIFIFLGIAAFALGGTFGAVINSIFPALAGVGLGSKTDSDKEKLDDDNVQESVDNAIKITHTDDI